jgi:hypothetical protein
MMGQQPQGPVEAQARKRAFDVIFDAYGAIRNSPVPVIGVVQGRALGFGCAVAAVCDITLASDKAQIGDVYNAYQYLANPADHFLLQESDTVLADFGAGWLYIRYLVDQFGPGLTLKLEQTTHTGTDNVSVQTTLPFTTTVTRWALDKWVSDLPGFTPPAELRYSSWSFRSLFASLSAQDPFDFPSPFPLVPLAGPGTRLSLAGTLAAGSGAYVRALQGPNGAGFSMSLTGASGGISTVIAPKLDVIRIR